MSGTKPNLNGKSVRLFFSRPANSTSSRQKSPDVPPLPLLTTAEETYFPANSYDPAAEWARSDDDRRHKFDMLGSVEASRFFTVGTALSLYSGKPVTITTGSDNNHDGIANARWVIAAWPTEGWPIGTSMASA